VYEYEKVRLWYEKRTKRKPFPENNSPRMTGLKRPRRQDFASNQRKRLSARARRIGFPLKSTVGFSRTPRRGIARRSGCDGRERSFSHIHGAIINSTYRYNIYSSA